MKLSNRLNTVANLIDFNESICDIGTDHGFLPIYLKDLNPNRKTILSDISKDSLNKAKTNANNLSNLEFDFRLGDGLKVLDNNEVDTVILLGVGGLLTCQILNDDIKKSHSFNKYIFGPRNHTGELRYYLAQNNFIITKEELVKESRFICEILEVKNGIPNIDSDMILLSPDAIEWECPKTLLNFNLELIEPFVKRKLNREKLILLNLYRSTKIDEEKVINQKKRILYLENYFK